MFEPTDKIYPASESSEKNELPPVVSGWKHDFTEDAPDYTAFYVSNFGGFENN